MKMKSSVWVSMLYSSKYVQAYYKSLPLLNYKGLQTLQVISVLSLSWLSI